MKVSRRPAAQSDTEFARRVHHRAYHDVVVAQFGRWDATAQDRFFESDWGRAGFEVIAHEGLPCGYACIEDREHDIHLRELALLPHFQGKGIGTSILQDAMERAAERNVPIRLAALRKNRAIDLCRRLGFEETSRTETHVTLEWRPRSVGA